MLKKYTIRKNNLLAIGCAKIQKYGNKKIKIDFFNWWLEIKCFENKSMVSILNVNKSLKVETSGYIKKKHSNNLNGDIANGFNRWGARMIIDMYSMPPKVETSGYIFKKKMAEKNLSIAVDRLYYISKKDEFNFF